MLGWDSDGERWLLHMMCQTPLVFCIEGWSETWETHFNTSENMQGEGRARWWSLPDLFPQTIAFLPPSTSQRTRFCQKWTQR